MKSFKVSIMFTRPIKEMEYRASVVLPCTEKRGKSLLRHLKYGAGVARRNLNINNHFIAWLVKAPEAKCNQLPFHLTLSLFIVLYKYNFSQTKDNACRLPKIFTRSSPF